MSVDIVCYDNTIEMFHIISVHIQCLVFINCIEKYVFIVLIAIIPNATRQAGDADSWHLVPPLFPEVRCP